MSEQLIEHVRCISSLHALLVQLQLIGVQVKVLERKQEIDMENIDVVDGFYRVSRPLD